MAIITGTGHSQGDKVTFLTNVITMLNEIKADFNAVLTKLDTDAGLGQTNYNSTLAVGTANLAIGNIRADGILQADLVTLIGNIATMANGLRTNINALNVKLETDNAASSYNPENNVTSSALSSTLIVPNGCNWGRDLWPFLQAVLTLGNELKTDLNAIETKLDADTGVTLTTYASGNPVTTTDLTFTI